MAPVKIDENTKEISYNEKKTQAILNKNKKIIVLFHANWCGACKDLHKIWGATIKKYEKNNSKKNIIFEIEHSSFNKIKNEPLSDIIKEVSHIPMLFCLQYDKKKNTCHYEHCENLKDEKDILKFLRDAEKTQRM